MKVLVVDDEPVIADTLVEILRGEGHEAMAAADGASAIYWAELMRPDVVISDVIMPGLNGIETAQSIRRILPPCRIILFSGQSASIDLLETARRQGYSFEILAKPIDPEVLLRVINSNHPAIVNEE